MNQSEQTELFPIVVQDVKNPSVPLKDILKIAGGMMSRIVSPNLVMDVAVSYHLNYADYSMLCKCLFRVPQTEMAYVAKQKEADELHIAGIL